MRALWVDSRNDPDWVKVAKHKMTALYFDLYDPRIGTAYLTDVQRRNYAPGVYVVDNWPQIEDLSSIDAANEVSDRLALIMKTAIKPSFPKVQFDLERHDPIWIAELFEEWRRLRPTQDTSWTMEPMQGGWMSPDFVQRILACRVRVVPQYYGSVMMPFAADRCFRDLLIRGFPESIISGFYDAAALPANWDGFAFTQGRLP